MSKKIFLNVIEKNKYKNKEDIRKYINSIVNKLMANEFTNRID